MGLLSEPRNGRGGQCPFSYPPVNNDPDQPESTVDSGFFFNRTLARRTDYAERQDMRNTGTLSLATRTTVLNQIVCQFFLKDPFFTGKVEHEEFLENQ